MKKTMDKAPFRREGYFNSNDNNYPELPPCVWPRTPTPAWKGRGEFLAALLHVETLAKQGRMKGFSTCRVCGRMNGSCEFTYEGWL